MSASQTRQGPVLRSSRAPRRDYGPGGFGRGRAAGIAGGSSTEVAKSQERSRSGGDGGGMPPTLQIFLLVLVFYRGVVICT